MTPIAIQPSRQDDDLLVRKPARGTRQVGLRAGRLLDACTTRLVIMTVVQLRPFPIKPKYLRRGASVLILVVTASSCSFGHQRLLKPHEVIL